MVIRLSIIWQDGPISRKTKISSCDQILYNFTNIILCRSYFGSWAKMTYLKKRTFAVTFVLLSVYLHIASSSKYIKYQKNILTLSRLMNTIGSILLTMSVRWRWCAPRGFPEGKCWQRLRDPSEVAWLLARPPLRESKHNKSVVFDC